MQLKWFQLSFSYLNSLGHKNKKEVCFKFHFNRILTLKIFYNIYNEFKKSMVETPSAKSINEGLCDDPKGKY